MGEEVEAQEFSRADRTRHRAKVRRCLDVFARTSTEFSPDLGGPVNDNYRIGVGDRLLLTMTGDVESGTELLVNRQGFVVVPRLPRPLYVANLTKGEVDRLFFDALSRVYSGMTGQAIDVNAGQGTARNSAIGLRGGPVTRTRGGGWSLTAPRSCRASCLAAGEHRPQLAGVAVARKGAPRDAFTMLRDMTSELDRVFAALADPTRRAILARLSKGAATVNVTLSPAFRASP